MSGIHFSDEELVAYLDGETTHTPAEDIAVALRTDAVLAKRLAALRIDTHAIAQSFEATLNTGHKAPFILETPVQRNWIRHAAAAAIVGIVVGFGAGQFSADMGDRNWKQYVAAYQFLYTTNTLSNVQTSPAFQRAELNQIGAAIGKEFSIATLTSMPDVTYKRAQVLGYNGQPLVQLTFLSSTGEPIALCIIRSDDKSEASIVHSEMEGMQSANWQTNGYDYLLIGGQDKGLIARMANSFAAKNV